jgi:uncharacterized protein (TIGR02687 family)
MKAQRVDQALIQKFITENERIVFWHDAKGEFTDYLSSGLPDELSDVRVLDVASIGGLSAKLLLEREDPTGKYLVYSHGEVLPADEDWLLDIRIYSASFDADMASIWLQDLGLARLAMRDHLKAHAVFFGNQERRRKLAQFVGADDDEATLDLKMMAVLVNSPVASPFDVLRSLCHGHVQQGAFDLGRPPEVMATFEKMDLLARFWDAMEHEFSYTAEEPRIAGLLRQLLITELFRQTNDARMPSIAQHKLPATGNRNTLVFLTQWRDSNTHARSYDAVASAVATEQKIGAALAALDLETIRTVYTFWEAERRTASSLKEHLLAESQSVDADKIEGLARTRQSGHWLSGPGSDLPDRRAVADAYDAIVAAAKLFALHVEHRQGLRYEAPEDALLAYQETLHRFDRLYREFCTKAQLALGQGWDLLKALSDEVEKVYDQGFLQPLGIEWSRLLDEGFLGEWESRGLPSQQNFYVNNIRPHLAQSARKRAFVIVSDAFRYEAAGELVEELNGRYRMNAKLSAMLGVLPSYTSLGMASLLPHETLGYNEKGEILVDGNPVSGTDARDKHLASVQGMACQAKDLRVMKTEDARAFTQGKRVVYIYHDVIDKRSHTVEEETFDAVSDCIGELVALIQFCVNKLNAAKVWITADHGFLYQQDPPDVTDRSKLTHKPDQALKFKKRYVIGRNLGVVPEAHHGSIAATTGIKGEMEFWIPRAANRFHFTGGARFVHGGAMPQEIVVPLITVAQLRGKHKEGSRSEAVSVQVLGTAHKITTPRYRFELIQTESVDARKTPITLRAAVYDGAQPVTSVETITFDSTSDSIEERKKSITLELRRGTYDKSKPYRLVLRDIKTDAEVQSVPVLIDRSFDDDF